MNSIVFIALALMCMVGPSTAGKGAHCCADSSEAGGGFRRSLMVTKGGKGQEVRVPDALRWSHININLPAARTAAAGHQMSSSSKMETALHLMQLKVQVGIDNDYRSRQNDHIM